MTYPTRLTEQDLETLFSVEEMTQQEERHELQKIALNRNRLKTPPRLPKYKRYDKTYIACALEAMAHMEITKFQEQLIPRIMIRSSNMDFLHRLRQRMRLGKIGSLRVRKAPLKTTKALEITNLYEIAHILKETLPEMRVRRTKRISKLLIEFCKQPSLERQHQITEKIKEVKEKPNITGYHLTTDILEQELESRKTQY